MEEQIILVDAHGTHIGVAPKLASHHANTPLHLAFSCYVFNEQGKFLLTERAKSKKVWPGVLTNSFCGHPMPGEHVDDAIMRRAQYELGIAELRNITKIMDYQYKTPPYNGIIENEICPIYSALYSGEITPNTLEVESFTWVEWDWLMLDITHHPDTYSYWLKDQITHIANVSDLPLFASHR